MYTKEELGFILYNNRSVNGVVINFLPTDINPIRLINIESRLSKIKEKYYLNKFVDIDISKLNISEPDVVLYPDSLLGITDQIKKLVGKFSEFEYKYLIDRGFNDNVINDLSLIGLSTILDYETLIKIGSTAHPVISGFVDDFIGGGGIIIPLFNKEGSLVNCAIRKIQIENSQEFIKKSLKYSLACPDISIWGIDDIEEFDEVWITEGIFDMIALKYMGVKSVSCSSAMWSGPQLYRILDKNPKKAIIVCDNDDVGIRTGFILSDFFKSFGIETKKIISNSSKDPSEHFFIKGGNISDFREININEFDIKNIGESFDFIEYIKNRKF